MHLSLFNRPTTLTVVAVRAGGYQVGPHMLPAQVARYDVIHSKVGYTLTTILAGEIISAQYLTLAEFDTWAWAVDHFFQTDDGRARESLPNGFDLAASIQDQAGFSVNNEGYGTACIADVDRLEIRIKHKYWGQHFCLQWREL